MRTVLSIGVLVLAMLAAAGCSFLAKKTPTPAADLDKDELARRPAPPGERYYLALFGSINSAKQPKHSHTWATMARVKQVPGQARPEIEVKTISWMPATLAIRPASMRVEPGVNLNLPDSVRAMKQDGQTIEMWGPYEVWHGFWERFSVQQAFLESGTIGYQCTDTIGEAARLGNGCDCIHAISDMDPAFPRWRYPLTWYGPSATENLVRRIMRAPVTIDARRTHDWLLEPLNLTDCDIVRRQYRGRILPYDPAE
jgi:hypothetical protein